MKRHYINNELIHWTGRDCDESTAFKNLLSICDESVLRLSYCPQYVQEKFRPTSGMVCFTDMPLSQSKEHCSIFGRFGVAFHKQKMISYGANPVFYTTGSHLDRIKKVVKLTEELYELYKDREWKEQVEPYQFTDEQFLSLYETTEFLQEYSYKNKDAEDYVTYYQREWRLAVSSLPSSLRVHKPGTSSAYSRGGKPYQIFQFSNVDVAYIVVPLRFYFQARKLARKLSCGLKIYELTVKG